MYTSCLQHVMSPGYAFRPFKPHKSHARVACSATSRAAQKGRKTQKRLPRIEITYKEFGNIVPFPQQPPFSNPSGSFKMRGVGLACARAVKANASCLVASSGGNAGQAVAVAGKKLDVPTVVYVPSTTSERAIESMRANGAVVHLAGTCLDDAIQAAQEFVSQNGSAVFIPPFDHPDVFLGNSTIIDESVRQLAEQGKSLDAVLCSVGGGGLLTGIIDALQKHGLHHVPVVAVETDGAASLAASLADGQLVTLKQITSIATTLGAKRVAARAFAAALSHPTLSMVVTDKEAVDACLQYYDDTEIVVEPACGAAQAPLYIPEHIAQLRSRLTPFADTQGPKQVPAKGPLGEDFNLVVVVCGGTTVTLEGLHKLEAKLATQ